MAKVLNPLNSSEARGRVGGLVYNTWRGIRYVKAQVAPEHEDDPKRQAHKAIVQAAGIRWRTIGDLLRSQWHDYANLHPDIDWTGSPKRIAGYHWYVRVQVRLIDCGYTYIDTPPTDTAPASWLGMVAALAFNEWAFDWTDTDPGATPDSKFDAWITKPLSAGKHPTIHDAHRDGLINVTDQIYTYILPLPGTYTAFYRCITRSGLTGPWLSERVTYA